jgi:4-hydroxy-3-methylbut-2-enyl diphosphate reductase
MTYVDATCPLVSKVHREAENLNKAGYHIILIGHKNHPEVIGTMGQLPEGSIDLIQNEEEAKNYENKNNKKIAFVTQTTLSVDDTKDIIQILSSTTKFTSGKIKKLINYGNEKAHILTLNKDTNFLFTNTRIKKNTLISHVLLDCKKSQ